VNILCYGNLSYYSPVTFPAYPILFNSFQRILLFHLPTQIQCVLILLYCIDPKNKCIYKTKHDHTHLHIEQFVIVELFYGTQGRGEKKREWESYLLLCIISHHPIGCRHLVLTSNVVPIMCKHLIFVIECWIIDRLNEKTYHEKINVWMSPEGGSKKKQNQDKILE
jgi:hypothetical protein